MYLKKYYLMQPVPGSLSVWTTEKAGRRRARAPERGLVEKEGATLALSFHFRIPLAADPACRSLGFSIVLTDREPGTGYI